VFYVGLDVHRRRTQVAVIDDEGHELFNRNVVNDPERLGSLLSGLEPRSPVVLEAAYGSASRQYAMVRAVVVLPSGRVKL